MIHLAAQAGVRYSIDYPRAYMKSNIIGTFEILKLLVPIHPTTCCWLLPPQFMVPAKICPTKKQLELITKYHFMRQQKSTENMAHSYSHLFNLPITVFRFFTVYGPWGRPDMAIFKFTKSILKGNILMFTIKVR